MRTALVTMESISAYSQSNFLASTRGPKESPDVFEERCWREKAHSNAAGNIVIPAMAFKNALDEATKRLQLKVKGGGQTTWTKYFQAGIAINGDIELPVKAADVEGEWLMMNADGRKGGGTRVRRCFPVIREWKATVPYIILDDKITEDVFEKCVRESGLFVGIGRWRPEKCGLYGRFNVTKIQWS